MDLYEKISRNKHNVTSKELIELLESYGFEHRRSTASGHAIYKRKGYSRPFPVPLHKGTLLPHIVEEALRMIKEIRELDQDKDKINGKES